MHLSPSDRDRILRAALRREYRQAQRQGDSERSSLIRQVLGDEARFSAIAAAVASETPVPDDDERLRAEFGAPAIELLRLLLDKMPEIIQLIKHVAELLR